MRFLSRARKHARLVATVGVAVAGVAAVVAVVAGSHPGKPPGFVAAPSAAHGVLWHRLHPVHTPPLPVRSEAYLGVYETTSPGSYSGIDEFAAAIGHQPDVALYYSGWGEPFRSRFAAGAHDNGAIPLVQIDPENTSLTAIAAGAFDAYLESYADQVATYGHPVLIGFGHEMNGPWSSWGYHHTSPAVFVAAWRHIVDVFRLQGADNVTWLWTINRINDFDTGPPADWWPGADYVTWVGIDGYYFNAGDKFAAMFGPTINQVRHFTLDPVLISETAVAPGRAQAAGIRNLFGGIRAYGDLGLVWFDGGRNGGADEQDFRLEGDPAALAAFRQGSAAYQRQAG